jgi:predicted DNA-binding protein
MSQSQLCIRVPEHELQILDRYAKQAQRTKTDIIREFIRSLADEVSFQQPLEGHD